MKMRERSNAYHTTIVCVDSYTDGVPAGRFYNPYLQEGVRFASLVDFLQKMESLLDDMNFPQTFTVTRTFAPVRAAEPALAEERIPSGGMATFSLKVLFRQNSSWQGSIAWLEGKREEGFRSVLELIFLMDSALTA